MRSCDLSTGEAETGDPGVPWRDSLAKSTSLGGSQKFCLQNSKQKAGKVKEMAQHLRALAALPEDLGSIPSTHMVAQRDMVPSSDFFEYQTHTCYTDIDAGKIPIYNK